MASRWRVLHLLFGEGCGDTVVAVSPPNGQGGSARGRWGSREVRTPLEHRGGSRASDEGAEVTGCTGRREKPLTVFSQQQPVPHTDTGGLGEVPQGGRAILG